jgi:transposase InsO family protein
MAELRLEVLMEPELTGDPVTKVCKRRRISRDRFYEYRRRFAELGPIGLEPRSRRPRRSPNKTPADLEATICELRKAHPDWGPRTIASYLRRHGTVPPAISTIGRILERNDLVARGKSKPKATKRFERQAPNDLWQIDATQITLSDKTRVWVIDVIDDHSRYLVGALAADRLTSARAWACLEGGLAMAMPEEVVSDNGWCFTGRFRPGREVEFERRLAALGIKHIMTTPFHPQTIGKIERLHRTLKAWLRLQPPPGDVAELQALLDRFRTFYNHDRCHQAIGDVPPAERFVTAVKRQAPTVTRRHVRKIDGAGRISLFKTGFYVGYRRAGQLVDVEQTGDRIRILFGQEVLADFALVPGKRYYGPRR